jgi:hypothetical protein
MRWIGILLVFAGCQSGSPGQPDVPDVPVDGEQHSLGMFVDWDASPHLPGALTDKIIVSDVTFQLDHFQLVADAGSVARSKYLLAWAPGAAPSREAFPDAPPGVYSKITLVMMGGGFGDYSYRIHGTWRDGLQLRPFEIRDRATFSVSLDCNEMLLAAGSATLEIKVDLREAISQIDFKDLKEDDGVLELHDGPELADLRDRLQRTFKLEN